MRMDDGGGDYNAMIAYQKMVGGEPLPNSEPAKIPSYVPGPGSSTERRPVETSNAWKTMNTGGGSLTTSKDQKNMDTGDGPWTSSDYTKSSEPVTMTLVPSMPLNLASQFMLSIPKHQDVTPRVEVGLDKGRTLESLFTLIENNTLQPYDDEIAETVCYIGKARFFLPWKSPDDRDQFFEVSQYDPPTYERFKAALETTKFDRPGGKEKKTIFVELAAHCIRTHYFREKGFLRKDECVAQLGRNDSSGRMPPGWGENVLR